MNNATHSGDAGSYADRVEGHVPGLRDLHKMIGLLLAERVPKDGRVLVLGAGGGLELLAFAKMHPHWRFDGVDPSIEMIQQAKHTLGEREKCVIFHEGYIYDAPVELFDGATCLLTLHFLPREERLHTLREISQRLKPGAPLVVMHHSYPQTGPQQDIWLRRNADFIALGGVSASSAEKNIEAMREDLPALSPEEDDALLKDAGFENAQLFYAAFTFKGWIAYNSGFE